MLLRRITQHVKDQNWFAVFIDFIIVVIGVFIGIQVNNWNTQRIEQSYEYEYLTRLQSNMQESFDNTNRTNKRWIRRVSYLNGVLKSLDTCQLAPNTHGEFAEALYHLGKFEMAFLNDSTLEEMKATGRLGIIKNHAITQALDTVTRAIKYQQRVEPQLIAHLSPHIAYVNQRTRFEISSVEELKALDQEGKYANIMNFEIDALCTDPQLIASIDSIRRVIFEILEWNNRTALEIEIALNLIKKELESL